MGCIIRPRRNKRRPADVGGVPVTTAECERTAAQQEEPDAIASSRDRRAGPTDTRGAVQTDIEAADERKTGSVEAVPQAGPQDSVAGFFEPPADPADGAPMPPHLQER